MRQFLEIKERHPDAIVFFRLGDFYEMFFEDAVTAAELLDLTLTTRDKGKEDAVPMCGVPHHSARNYIGRLVDAGHRVVICEQTEDPKAAKGLVKREVTRIVTPGITLDEEALDPKAARYVAALWPVLATDAAQLATDTVSAQVAARKAGVVAPKPARKAVARPDGAPGNGTRGGAQAAAVLAGARVSSQAGTDVDAPAAQSRSALRTSDGHADRGLTGPGRVVPRVAVAYLDVTTGEFRATVVPVGELVDELTRIGPREIVLVPEAAQAPDALGQALRELPALARGTAGTPPLGPWTWTDYQPAQPPLDGIAAALPSLPAAPPAALAAAGLVLAYAQHTQPGGMLPVARLDVYDANEAVVLDEAAIANLELTETLMGRKRAGSLLAVLDETCTAPGARLLRRWLLFPLVAPDMIAARQDAVAFFVAAPSLRTQLRTALRGFADMERLAARATLAVATPRDLGRLRDALAALPQVSALLQQARADLPASLQPTPLQALELQELGLRLTTTLATELPPLLKDGGVIAAGVDAEIDACRALTDGGEKELLEIEAREQALTGISSLKVRYNRVFGYYIEVTKSNLSKVPAHFVRKQTVATGERFVTVELADLERRVLAAEETLAAREAALFRNLVAAVAAVAVQLGEAAAMLALLDVVAGLAEGAARRNYVRPLVDASTVIEIHDGRHPVVEDMLPTGSFVPNDCMLDAREAQLMLITGPNMAGKSTYMRQVAHIVLLAQMGAFVPARACRIGVCDRIFTRVGAADNLARGDSTFMVEMRETSHILAKASQRSLVVLDEVGRGTSTYDGVSLAWAITEYLHDAIGARTLFATHYHELIGMAQTRGRIRNYSAAIRESQGEVVFLRRIVAGGANRSYGIEVARLAGLPRAVVARARQLLTQLEGGAALGQHAQLSLLAAPAAQSQPTQTEEGASALLAALRELDIDQLTPLAALALLAKWQEHAKRG